MGGDSRIEQCLEAALDSVCGAEAPPKLSAAMRHAVFPGGKRVRPRMCLAVAASCGGDQPKLAAAAATALELLHCASLVHDDLPCFDDAEMRRGVPSVHSAFGEPLAVLTGDALIVLAFDTLAAQIEVAPGRAAVLLRILSQAVGTPHGIVAGQAWESEDDADLATYHRAKTGALFAAAAAAGAAAAGEDPVPWRALGDRLGEAYQIADDIADTVSDAKSGRPNAVAKLGLSGARELLQEAVDAALSAIPACQGEKELRVLMRAESERLLCVNAEQDAA